MAGGYLKINVYKMVETGGAGFRHRLLFFK